MSSDDADEPTTAELRERVQALEEYLWPDRRDVLRAGAAGLGGAAAGAALTGGAGAQPTGDEGQVGTQSNRVEAWISEADAQEITTGEQNNNEINLTSLVEDGTYMDILEAVVSEPSNHSRGSRFVIEPGTYQVSTQRTLTESNFEVVAYGSGHIWNEGAASMPVLIEWTGTVGGGENMLQIGDNATKVEGVTFRGLEFSPQSGGDAVTGVHFGGGATAPTRDVSFERCAWRDFGNDPISTNTGLDNFNHKYIGCSWHSNSGTAITGSQAELRGGYILTLAGEVGVSLGNKSQLYGLSADLNGASTGIEGANLCKIFPQNIEGDGTAGSIGVKTSGSDVSHVGGGVHDVDVGIESTGPLRATASMANIGSDHIRMTGGNHDHNGSVLIGYNSPDVNYTTSELQNVIQIPYYPESNIAPGDVPPGFRGVDLDRGGTGTTALIIGGNSLVGTDAWYIDVDGSL